MSEAPPRLFDHALLVKRLRQRPAMRDGSDFLLNRLAEDLADRLAPVLRPFPAILDIGTPTDAFHTAMTRIRPEATVRHASLETATGENLGLQPESADLVTSGLFLQHLNDLPGVLMQIRRALRPDGLFMGCLAGGATLTELRQSLTTAEADVTGGISPRVFPFADTRDMGGLLQRAGLALPVTDSETITVRYDNVFRLMHDLRAMGATNILTQRLNKPTQRAVFLRAAALYAEKFGQPDGRIPATFEIIWLSGWAPHESQQKPLKPGSAKQRLADALGAIEKKV
jgi:SAM-dependent methyltransferase